MRCDYLQSPEQFICLLREIWNENYGRIDIVDDTLTLHTGGWSGNEVIIEALTKTIFWSFCWEKSWRGGHYEFKLKRINPNDIKKIQNNEVNYEN
jgi:hypothetical protein